MVPHISILNVRCPNFEELSHEYGDGHSYMPTPITNHKNCGVSKVVFYPGGDENSEYETFSVFLYFVGTGIRLIGVSCIIRDSMGGIVEEKRDDCYILDSNSPFATNFEMTRSKLLELNKERNILLKGDLLLEFEIQYHQKQEQNVTIQHNIFRKNMLELLTSGEGSDIIFKVQDQQINAHQAILKANAPELSRMCEGSTDDIIEIHHSTPETFRIVLEYVYAMKVPHRWHITENGKEIIDVANRYGVIGLKLWVESTLVANCVIEVENVVDYILFADAKTCPLLKEYALSYFCKRTKDIMAKESFAKLKESMDLMEDVMMVMANKLDDAKEGREVDQRAIEMMSVEELRKRLNAKGLEVDGSKETLIARLKNASNKRRRVL